MGSHPGGSCGCFKTVMGYLGSDPGKLTSRARGHLRATPHGDERRNGTKWEWVCVFPGTQETHGQSDRCQERGQRCALCPVEQPSTNQEEFQRGFQPRFVINLWINRLASWVKFPVLGSKGILFVGSHVFLGGLSRCILLMGRRNWLVSEIPSYLNSETTFLLMCLLFARGGLFIWPWCTKPFCLFSSIWMCSASLKYRCVSCLSWKQLSH